MRLEDERFSGIFGSTIRLAAASQSYEEERKKAQETDKEKERQEIAESRRVFYEEKEKKRVAKEKEEKEAKAVERAKGIAECGGDADLYDENRATAYYEERYRYYMACANGHKEKIKKIAANRKVREENKGKVASEVAGDQAVSNSKSVKGSAKRKKSKELSKELSKGMARAPVLAVEREPIPGVTKGAKSAISITPFKKTVVVLEGLDSPTISVSEGEGDERVANY